MLTPLRFVSILVASIGLGLPLAGQAEEEAQGDIGDDVKDFEELNLEDLLNVVVSATKTEQTVEEAPAVVTVLNAQEIRAWGYDSVADVLRHVAGVYLVDNHISPDVGVRGVGSGLRSESGLIKVMIDGHTVAMRQTGANWLGPELIPMSAIERVEVIRGPASALYGADAFLGVVNIITLKGDDLAGGRVILGGGFDGTKLGGSTDLAVGFKTGELDVLVAGRLGYRDLSELTLPGSSPSPKLPASRANDTRAEGLEQTSGTGLLKLAYGLGDAGQVSMTGYMSYLDRGAEFADWLQLGSGLDESGRTIDNQVSIQQGYVDLRGEFKLSTDWRLEVDGLYFRGSPGPRDRIELGSDIYYVERKYRYQGGELHLGAQYQALPSLAFVAGVGVIYDEELLPSYLHVLKTKVGSLEPGDVRESTSTHAGIEAFLNPDAYLQVSWTPIEKTLSLTGGIRYDWHNIYGSQVSGRAGAVYQPLDKLYLKLLYGHAFKAPAPLLLYGEPMRSGDIQGNPDLEPQRVDTFELQVSYEPWDFLQVSTDLAYSYLQDKAEFTLQGVNKVARNVAEMGLLSWETEIRARWKRWIQGYLNLSMAYLVRDLGQPGYVADLLGSESSTYPTWLMHAGVRGQLPWLPLRLTLELSYVDTRDASDENALEAGEVYALDPYVMLNASLALFDLELLQGHKSEIRLIGTNLIGVEGPDPGYGGVDYPLAPRTIYLQLWMEL
ncbi:MAG TPA: TonB-dependent receptor [Myxococcota bacterium]|nr:TonB-dependent receptor [Myxococcota bacterium]HRY95892.1 TonB-dependent receptor [Myxococcota bacterium]HSA22411.1 TonB-dependent receptor [Myxococcota bacterium]